VDVFVIRVWEQPRSVAGPGQPVLLGAVEHLGSREASAFVGGDVLVDFLTRRCEELASEEGSSG
jgi:hypothetical protein